MEKITDPRLKSITITGEEGQSVNCLNIDETSKEELGCMVANLSMKGMQLESENKQLQEENKSLKNTITNLCNKYNIPRFH